MFFYNNRLQNTYFGVRAPSLILCSGAKENGGLKTKKNQEPPQRRITLW